MTIIISVEGNIGCGKTTLIEELKQHYYFSNKKILFLSEPIDIWQNIVDNNNVNILNAFYNDKQKYSFPFQLLTISSRTKLLQSNINKYDIIVTERSIYTDKNVFSKMLFDSNYIDDLSYNIYNYVFEDYNKSNNNHNIQYFYLCLNPKLTFSRIQLRNREEEKGITLEYINNCHEYHEKWLRNEKNTNVEIVTHTDLNILKNHFINYLENHLKEN